MTKKWWFWTLIVILVIVIIGFFTRKKWMQYLFPVDASKGTPPSGCGENRMGENQRGWFSDKSIPYYYQFNRPYYKFKKGDKVIGTCKRISNGDFADSWDCDIISFYYNGKTQEASSDALDELEKVPTPVVGFNDPNGDWMSGCTKPIYDTSTMPNSSEICFTASDLELKNGDTVPSTIKVAYRNLGTKTWHYNRTGADSKYCYVYNPDGKYNTFN